MLQFFPDKDFVTVDDDVHYPPNTLETLWAMHKSYPNDVICRSDVEITDICKAPNEWHGSLQKKLIHQDYVRIIGVGGVFYPSKSLYKDSDNMKLASELCPWADDLWLTMMCILNGTKFTKEFTHCNPLTVKGTQTVSLSSASNKLDFAKEVTNEEQWANLLKYYMNELGIKL